jgi:2-iminobutanoate/2-iminopropanoate deaminase
MKHSIWSVSAAPVVVLVFLVLVGGCASPPTVHVSAPGALGPYSASVVTGDLVFVSGRIGRTDGSPFEEEVSSAIGALEVELKKVGIGLGDVVSVTAYLTDMGLYAPFNEAYGKAFPEPFPARVCVAVSALPAKARVEIAAVARRR